MDLEKLKKISKIDTKIIFRKLSDKFLNLFIDRFYRIRDYKVSTFSYDYIAYFKLYMSQFDFADLFEINIDSNQLNKFSELNLQHQHIILSDKVVSINSNFNFNQIQNKFPKSLIPFTTKCYNKIKEDYRLINWQSDFNSKFSWEIGWYKDIVYGNNSGADIKVPWELGRLQHLPWLALKFKETKEYEFKTEIRNQLFDFMSTNPPNFGVQWMTSMDIGIRLINIIFTISIFDNINDVFDNSEIELIDSYLFDHYLHIKNNIEFSEGLRGNHYLSNLNSILIYLCFVDDNDTNDKLIDRYIRLIEIELDYQFNEDGSNFEGSTRYHIFTNQMLITSDIILQKTKRKSLNKSKMNKICCFTYELLQFENPPQIGDNDSGFFWKVINDEKLTYEVLKKLIIKNYKINEVSKYNNFGYIREKYNNLDLIFKCGELGQYGKGGHDHNDNLSYELYFNGQPFIVDAGTYCYTSNFEKRNYYRKTSAHNVLTIGDNEQNNFGNTTNDDMFWMDTNRSNAKIMLHNKNNINGVIKYCGKQYSRNIIYDNDEIIITDLIENELEKKVHIHLCPEINIDIVEKGVYKLWKNESSIYLDTNINKTEIIDYYYSEKYGVEKVSKVIILYSNNKEIQHKYRALS